MMFDIIKYHILYSILLHCIFFIAGLYCILEGASLNGDQLCYIINSATMFIS